MNANQFDLNQKFTIADLTSISEEEFINRIMHAMKYMANTVTKKHTCYIMHYFENKQWNGINVNKVKIHAYNEYEMWLMWYDYVLENGDTVDEDYDHILDLINDEIDDKEIDTGTMTFIEIVKLIIQNMRENDTLWYTIKDW